MEKKTRDMIIGYYQDFLKEYNQKLSKQTWEKQSKIFKEFWINKIMSSKAGKLTEDQMIPIIQILDVKGLRRNDKERSVEGVAFTNIFQPHWYQVFRDIQSNKEIKTLLDMLFSTRSEKEQIDILNTIKEKSDIKNLTGENSVILNAFLFVNDPQDNITMVSLDDRFRTINFFNLGNTNEIRSYGYGEKIIATRNLVLKLKNNFGFDIDNRGLSCFLYYEPLKVLWKQKIIEAKIEKPKKVNFSPVSKRAHAVGENINFRGMDYAPVEENGVIFLFSKITEDVGLKIISIQKHFPDALGIRYNTDGKGYHVYIEFEHKSSDFVQHGHLEQMKKGKQCDVIVCWEHDWKDCPKEITVIELKDYIKNLPKDVD